MKLGICLPVFSQDASSAMDTATRAAGLGFDGVFCPDHLISPSPGKSRGRPAFEAFSVLAAVAALDLGLHVGTLVSRVGLRAPGILAKQAAALDLMSAGRAIVGIGTGDVISRPENLAFDIPFPVFADRLALLEETAMALRDLFEGRPWEGGRWVPAMNGPLEPAGSPQIWVGGSSEAVVSVAARTADTWNGWQLDEAVFASKVAFLRNEAGPRAVAATWAGIVLVGEDEAELASLKASRGSVGLPVDDIWSGTAAELRDFSDRLQSLGATWFIALAAAGKPGRMELIARALT